MSEDRWVRTELTSLVRDVEDVGPGLSGQVRLRHAQQRRRARRLTAVASTVGVVAVVAGTLLLVRTTSSPSSPGLGTPTTPTSQRAPATAAPVVPPPTQHSPAHPSSPVTPTPAIAAPAGPLGTGRYFVSTTGNAGRQRLLATAVGSAHRLATVAMPTGSDVLGLATGRPDTVFVLVSQGGSAQLVRVTLSSGASAAVATVGTGSTLSGDVFADPAGVRVAVGSRAGETEVVDAATGTQVPVPHGRGQLVGWTPDGTALEYLAATGDRVALRHLDGSAAGTIALPSAACHHQVLAGVVFAWTRCTSTHAALVALDPSGAHQLADLGKLPTPKIASALVSADGGVLVFTSAYPTGCSDGFTVDVSTGGVTSSGPPSAAAAQAAGCAGVSLL